MAKHEGIQLPEGMELLQTQVGGHEFDPEKRKVGMLRGSNGRIFKPITKPDLGDREIAFYENLIISSDPVDMDIQRYTPTYYGTREMRVFDKNVKFLELEDTTHGMAEPCVMDVKIGRRTWDPSATQEKRASEDSKYAESKQVYGFCVPGFQVYKLPSGTLQRFDKSYGKKLNSKTLVEALETFLNGSASRPPCRELVTQLLSVLWKILALFREQRRYRLYSSSLLIAYDAKRLRQLVHRKLNNSFAESLLRMPVTRSRMMSNSGVARSLGSLNLQMGSPTTPPATPPARPVHSGFPFVHAAPTTRTRPSSPSSPTSSPGIRRAIHRLQSMKRSISLQNCESLTGDRVANSPSPVATVTGLEYPVDVGSGGESRGSPKRPELQVHKLCRTHSYSNNFDADIIQMKEDYAALLSELSSSCEEKQNWVRVHMIDFAHVFPVQDDQLDTNYLEGVESLIKLLENFLK